MNDNFIKNIKERIAIDNFKKETRRNKIIKKSCLYGGATILIGTTLLAQYFVSKEKSI